MRSRNPDIGVERDLADPAVGEVGRHDEDRGGDRVAAFADDRVETSVAEMVEGRVVLGPSGQFDDLAETGPLAQRLLGESGAVLGNQVFAFGVTSAAVDLDALAKVFGADSRRMSPAPSTIEKELPPSGSDDTRLRCQTEGW